LNKIFFCGDVHGNFEHLIQAVREHWPAALILLGDVQAQRPLELELAPILDETELWFVHGNHDSEQDYDNLFGSSLASRNFHGKVIEVAGVRIAGLGGIFLEARSGARRRRPRMSQPQPFWKNRIRPRSGAAGCL
jgi:predicted phosphodiesterase